MIHKKANPMNITKYEHWVELFKLYNSNDESEDWMDLNNPQNFTGRNDYVNVFDTSSLKVGKNILVNRMSIINGEIKHD